ncbi:unnamed protein product [Ectocarpus sp. 12 AP-2014]
MAETHFPQHRARLEALRAEYISKLPEIFQRLDTLTETLPVDGAPPNLAILDRTLTQLSEETHKLAGSSGTLGLADLSAAARQLLSLAEHWHAHPLGARAKKDLMVTLVSTMRDCSRRPAPDVAKPIRQGTRMIHIVEDNELVAHEILTWLTEAGFDAQVFLSSSVYLDTFESLPTPDMVLMDVAFGKNRVAGPDTIRQLRDRLGQLPAVVFFSIHDNTPARLAALRAGASRYLVKPVSKTQLIDVACEFAQRRKGPKYRVLMVDDDQIVLETAKLHLEHVGLDVHISDEPMKALEIAREIKPDVIILDIFMPDISGTELAGILREDRQFDPTSIVFLTAQTHRDEKTLSVALGGDDYILKPFDTDYLTATVFARARRSRRLRGLLESKTISESDDY